MLPLLMTSKAFRVVISGALLLCCFIAWLPHAPQQDNTRPKVVITTPAANSTFNWNELVRYSISVVDKEDGNSAYEEIAPNEVFLKIRFVADSSRQKIDRAAEARNSEPRELTLIKSGDCLNCHAFKSKLIGPSFETIAKQYVNKPNAIALLSKKVIRGSEANTGTEKMPAHPGLTNSQAAGMVQWIIKNAGDPNVDYLRGLEGTFRTCGPPPHDASKSIYILTASYTDHGLPDQPATQKRGSCTLVLRSPQ